MAALRQDARNVRKQTLFLEKHKNVTTKSFYITSDGFIQTFRFYLIHLSQVKVKHHFLPPDGVDLTLHQGQQIFLLDIVLHNLKFNSYTNDGAKIAVSHETTKSFGSFLIIAMNVCRFCTRSLIISTKILFYRP